MVKGCVYINVFIAGATNIGFLTIGGGVVPELEDAEEAGKDDDQPHDLIIDVNKLSDIPLVILAKVFADNGAKSIISAHFLNSLCKINFS